MTPEEKKIDKEKDGFINKIKPQLDYDGLLNMTQWFKDNSTEDFHHWGYVRSIAYRMERLGLATVIPEDDWMNKANPKFWIKHSKWQDRHPYRHHLFITLIASIFSLTVALSVLLIKERPQKKIDDKQNFTLQSLHDSVINFRHEMQFLKDTLAKYKRQ